MRPNTGMNSSSNSNYRTQIGNSSGINNNTISYGANSNTMRSTKPTSTSSKSKVINTNHTKNIDDDYIANLQKQIYYLELETKLMKDREIETKNKVGGYEILFRDGVPLNEHFLALKTKYTNEKDRFDSAIQNLENEISELQNENLYYEQEIANLNNSYHNLMVKKQETEEAYESRINDLRQRLINEKNLIDFNSKQKDILGKDLFKINSANGHLNRTIEKNMLFKEDKEEKNTLEKQKLDEKFQEIDKLVERSLLEEEALKRKYEKTSHSKLIEEENSQLIFQLNKLDRDMHINQAKITELENIRELNLKYLKDEALNRKIHEKENIKLNQELENLSKLNEENMRVKVRENELKQLVIIRNKIKNSEHRMNALLQLYKDTEKEARELLEEKNLLQQKLAQLIEDSEGYNGKENNLNSEIIGIRNDIDDYMQVNSQKIDKLKLLEDENARLYETNERLEEEIKANRIKIDETMQRIALNEMLKDVDLNELKMVAINNHQVNESINQIMGKWDKVYSKLSQIESLHNDK
jgi:hypothetical protein